MRKHKNHSLRGFTLIEIMIITAIIGILSAIGFNELGGVRDRARDANRITEFRTIIQALQLYYDDNQSWPVFDPSLPQYQFQGCASGGGAICFQDTMPDGTPIPICKSYWPCRCKDGSGKPVNLKWLPGLESYFSTNYPPLDPSLPADSVCLTGAPIPRLYPSFFDYYGYYVGSPPYNQTGFFLFMALEGQRNTKIAGLCAFRNERYFYGIQGMPNGSIEIVPVC